MLASSSFHYGQPVTPDVEFRPSVLRAPPAVAPRRLRGLAPMSAVIFTHNDSATLRETLASLQWCQEVLVLDGGSTDGTDRIAAEFPNVRWHVTDDTTKSHNRALEAARHDWVLLVERDEIVSEALAAELRRLRPELHVAYAIPVHTYFNRRHITTCGLSKRPSPRLFNRHVTGFTAVDSRAIQTGHLQLQRLRQPLQRRWVETSAELLVSTHLEARRFARQHAGEPPVSPVAVVAKTVGVFLKSYFLQRGMLQGFEGLVLSVARAQGTFWKYAFLREAEGAEAVNSAPAPAGR